MVQFTWRKEYWCPLCECESVRLTTTPGTTSRTLNLRTVGGSFIVTRRIYYISKGFSDVAFLSKNTSKSNRLQMSLERQHFLLSCLKTLSVGLADVWTGGLPLGRPALINWFSLYWQLWGWNWVGVVSNSTIELFRGRVLFFCCILGCYLL